MEPYTLNRDFSKQDIIDGFNSVIWTERYYGDSDVELVVPITSEMVRKLPLGVFLGIEKSDELMILETVDIEGGKLKYKGISVLQWLNNRFVRASSDHTIKEWPLDGVPGKLMWDIVYNMCCEGSPYLDGTIDTGVDNPERLVIPGLRLSNYDDSGESVHWPVPYGPVYDPALTGIATTHEIGMQILLESDGTLGFRSYKGLDRTSKQTENSPVRFSAQLDSLSNIKETQSIALLKTLVYAYATDYDGDDPPEPGVSSLTGPQYVGFDLRALQVLDSSITSAEYEDVPLEEQPAKVHEALNSLALDALTTNSFVGAVDGEIIPQSQFKYGVHYNLGDLIETEGNTGVISVSRITEYIRSHDEAGEKEYPTVEMIE